MNIIRRTVTLILSLMLLAGLIPAQAADVRKTRPTVTVQSLSSTEDMQRAVEAQCPDIEIKWYLSSQVHENAYLGMTDTPDILLRQTYYLDEQGSGYLRDVSELEVVNNYSKNIIDSFRAADGALYWLPVLGTGYVLAANPALFEKYGIAMPHDFESLAAADAAFKAEGLDGVAWGLSDSYPFSAMLMAITLGADLYNSVDGMRWRSAYMKQEDDYTLDQAMWPEIFSRFRRLLDSGLIDEDDLQASTVMAGDAFANEECAMALVGSASISALGGMHGFEVLPVFDTEGQAWLPLYMNLRVGISAGVTDERLPAVLQVMNALTSTRTYQAYMDSRGGVIPMNNDGGALPEDMAGLHAAADAGYTFMLFNDQNGGLPEGVCNALHTMAAENLSAEQALTLCREEILKNRKSTEAAGLNDSDPSAVFYVSDADYPLITDENHNSPANSCIVNTLLKAVNTYAEEPYDILLMEGNTAGAPVRRGNYYTDAQGETNSFSSNFYYLINSSRAVYGSTMTVAELIRYINSSFWHFHRIDDGLAVMAGASYRVEKYPEGLAADRLPYVPNSANKGHVANTDNWPACYVCTGILKDGQELPPDQKVRVLVGRVEIFYITDYDKDSPSTWVGFDKTLKVTDAEGRSLDTRHLLEKYLREGHRLAEPTQYVQLTVK